MRKKIIAAIGVVIFEQQMQLGMSPNDAAVVSIKQASKWDHFLRLSQPLLNEVEEFEERCFKSVHYQ